MKGFIFKAKKEKKKKPVKPRKKITFALRIHRIYHLAAGTSTQSGQLKDGFFRVSFW